MSICFISPRSFLIKQSLVPRYLSEKYLYIKDNDTSEDINVKYHTENIVTRPDLIGLKNKNLLLLHGAEDRKVLLQNTMTLSERLVDNSIMFQQKVTNIHQYTTKLIEFSVAILTLGIFSN